MHQCPINSSPGMYYHSVLHYKSRPQVSKTLDTCQVHVGGASCIFKQHHSVQKQRVCGVFFFISLMEQDPWLGRLRLCGRPVLSPPCLLTCMSCNKNQLLYMIKIFRCLKSSFNLVFRSMGWLSPSPVGVRDSQIKNIAK